MRYSHFSKTERLELSILLTKGYSVRAVAQALKKSPSSVSREIGRNKVKGIYDPFKADHKAYHRRWISKTQGMKIARSPDIETYVRKYIQPPYRWSPERIAGRMKRDTGYSVRPDTIYKYLYSSYGAGLTRYLRYQKERRQHRKPSAKRVVIPQRTSIHERPAAISQRLIFGHGEADTMGRPRHASAQTLVVIRERISRKLFAKKVPRLSCSMEGFQALQVQAQCRSLTFDNGVENARHRQLGIPTYFADPYSSWQKGSIEQGIGMIRIDIPKQADLQDYSQEDIDGIVEHVNNLPMKCLGFKTPNEVYKELSIQIS